MNSAYLLSQIANGLILGSMYALIAIGFSMIYGIVRLINFAHGDIFTIGAFATLASISLGPSPCRTCVKRRVRTSSIKSRSVLNSARVRMGP